MKKQILTILSVLALSASAFAQGTVTVGNNAGSLITLNGNPMAIGSALFQLYAGPQGTAEGSLVAMLPTGGTSALAAGRMANFNVTVAGVAPAAVGTFQIWGWDSAYTTYADAVAAGSYVGKSVLFTATTGGVGEPPSAPTTLAGLYPGFALTAEIIPEPSTFALAGLGLAGLLLFRRRK